MARGTTGARRVAFYDDYGEELRARNDAESRAAWKSARDVAWPAQEKEGQGIAEVRKPAA